MQIDEGTAGRSRLSLTPVIDVVFLLLLFFMLASTFTRFAHVEVGVGGKAKPSIEQQKTPLVLLSVKKNGAYSMSGESVTLDEIQERLHAAAPDGKARIILRPSADAHAEDIIRAIEQSEATRLGPVIMVR